MRRTTIALALLMAGIVGLAGCTKPVLREKKIGDPLLTSKKPVEGKPSSAPPRGLVRDELPLPPRPGVSESIQPAPPPFIAVRGDR